MIRGNQETIRKTGAKPVWENPFQQRRVAGTTNSLFFTAGPPLSWFFANQVFVRQASKAKIILDSCLHVLSIWFWAVFDILPGSAFSFNRNGPGANGSNAA
jgi:hypothetical protein